LDTFVIDNGSHQNSGGDKSSQKNDIKQAKKEAKEMLEEDD